MLRGLYKKPITLKPYHTLDDAKNIMLKHNISRVIIALVDKPVGIITEKDIGKIVAREHNKRSIEEIILNDVMTKELVTVNEDADIKLVAKLMLSKGISSIIIVDDILKGIITKSDLMQAYSLYYRGKHIVKDYMTKDVFTVRPDDTISKVLKLMQDNNISRVVVVNNKIPVGIITYRDLLPLSTLIGYNTYLVIKEVFSNSQITGISDIFIANDLMKRNLLTVNEDADLADAADMMIKNKISGMPVVNINNELIGMITKTDITRAIADT